MQTNTTESTQAAYDSAYATLLQTLSDMTQTERIDVLLRALLTEKEQLELCNRVKIFALLQQGMTQRDISARLGVGVATVSRGAKAYQQHHVADLMPNLATLIEK